MSRRRGGAAEITANPRTRGGFMALVNSVEVLGEARRRGYAVGAFNANNLEYVQGIVLAAEREKAPVIIQASPGAIKYVGLAYIAAIGRVAADAPVPVVLHLDHGKDVDTARRCIDYGFPSVMFDGSELPLEENIRLTSEVARLAHAAGAACEGELGRVPTADRSWSRRELEDLMTDPDQASVFVERTGVDALAVSVGSIHKMKRQSAELDIDRIRRIRRAVDVPLVLHGSSGVSDDSLVEAVEAGLSKVNIATALNVAFTGAMRRASIERPEESDPRKLLGPAREAVAEVVAQKMRLLGASGRVRG